MKTTLPRPSRRTFLKTSALALGSGAVLPGAALAQGDSSGSLDRLKSNVSEEDYWQMVRAQFAFGDRAVPMNAANLCPSFLSVTDTMALYTRDIDIDCSFNNRSKFSTILEHGREAVALQLGVSADEIALVRNTSEANNIVNNGLQLDGGDEVLIWDQNHPTNNVAWEVRAARFGTRVRKFATPANPDSPEQLFDAIRGEIGSRTRVLSLTHVSNVSGLRLPIRELVEEAHARDIYVHLDGAQTWGAMDLDLAALGVDSYSASAHKWYMGPKEVGLLYVRSDNIGRIWPSVIAPGWGDDVEADPVGARKFESLGQRDDAALAALARAAALHDEIGPARIEARVAFLAQRLKQGISEAGLSLVTPMSQELSHGVCITRVPAGRGGEISNRLYQEHGIAAAATGGLRLCPTIYNTESHVDRAVAGVRQLLA